MEKILSVNDLNVSFDTYSGEVRAVRGVTFDLYKGETLAVVGESGSGKSVMSKSLMGLIPQPPGRITKGDVIYKGENISNLSDKAMRKYRGSELSMVFQDPMTSLNPTMKISKQISEGILAHQNISRREAISRSIELLELVGLDRPEERINQYPHQLSGGMQQRVVIAIALACNPEILIADEPTTALDVTVQEQVLNLLKQIQNQMETSIIFITHDLGVVANIADRVAVMYAGRIVEIGRTEEIFFNPQHPYTKGLLKAIPNLEDDEKELISIPGAPPNLLNPPKGEAFAQRNKDALKIDFLYQPPFFKVSETHKAATWLLHEKAKDLHVIGDEKEIEEVDSTYNNTKKDKEISSESLLEVNHLSRHFKLGRKSTLKAVNDISFQIYKGETFGLVGESGCGKSTLGRTIVSLHEPTDGKIVFKDQDIQTVNKYDLNKQIQMIFQDPYSSLNPRWTVADIIAEGMDIHNLSTNKKDRLEKVHELLRTVGLSEEHATRYPHEFSGGQRQRIGIARALAVDPEFIIADEPISALDVSIQAQVINLLKRLQKEKGLTYLFIAHDLSMVKHISDRIGVMYKGKIVEIAESNELFNNPLHPYTKVLLAANPIPDPSMQNKQREKVEWSGEFAENASLKEVSSGHWLYCTDEEYAQYKNGNAKKVGQPN